MSYKVWGAEGIDAGSFTQMESAMALPVAVGGALMPDAHLGYGLPIGGVLALDNAVCPFAVGVDIACRMKLSIFQDNPICIDNTHDRLAQILEQDTYFGVGVEHGGNNHHSVLNRGWGVSPITKENQAKARRQLGTSGSGNHFVEWGVFTVLKSCPELPYGERDQFTALMSHSGSRGTGAAVCNHYSRIAKNLHPEYGDLGWLELGTPEGDEYWAAMNLMGEYASANHDVIHREIALSYGSAPFFVVENHHNFAWKEMHNGREVIVHRKGATPAGAGVLGVIPGSMGTPAYLVRGKGNPDSLCSAAHGAGRLMSRKQAKKTFDYKTEIEKLKAQGVTVLSAGADEVVGVYKDIETVMAAQSDLVEIIGKFEPRIVKMSPSGRAED